MIAGVDEFRLFVLAVIVGTVLVWVLVAKFIMYAFGRLRGSGGDDGDTAPRDLWERAPGPLAPVKAASELTLAEQLYLLAYDPAADEGTYLSGTEDAMVRVCLAGALLIELFERELIYERPDGIFAVVERPGELPSLLEDAMTAISALLGGAEAWVYGLKSELKPIEKTVARSLVKRGVLAEERGKVLGLFPWTRFPTLDPAPRSELLERVHAVLLSTPRPDPTGPGMIQTRPRDPSEDEARLITLLELLALDMIELLVPRDRRKQARRRARQLPTGLRSAQGRVYRVLVEANQIP